jgi:hypothetical protein
MFYEPAAAVEDFARQIKKFWAQTRKEKFLEQKIYFSGE